MANLTNLFKARSAFPRPGYKPLIAAGWIVFAVSFALIAVISMVSVATPPSTNNLDKILHAGAHGVLTSGLIFAWPKRGLPLITILVITFGGIMEILQGTLAEGRTASIADAIANGLGALLVVLLWMGISKWIRRIPA